MTTETIEITTPDGVADAYYARPDDGDHPGVLFFPDAFGLRPQIRDMIERIAGWGYSVLAPNVFYRDGTAEELAPTEDLSVAMTRESYMATLMPRVRAMTPDLSDPDTTAFVNGLLALPGVSGTSIGTTGYCMGSALSLRAAAAHPDTVVAAAGFHGGNLATDKEGSPHRVVAGTRAELYFGHADNDPSMSPESIARLEAALDEAGITYTSELYPDAPHGYTMADTSSYQEAGAERHYRDLEALYGRNL